MEIPDVQTKLDIKKAKSVVIGPAGENLIEAAMIISRLPRIEAKELKRKIFSEKEKVLDKFYLSIEEIEIEDDIVLKLTNTPLTGVKITDGNIEEVLL